MKKRLIAAALAGALASVVPATSALAHPGHDHAATAPQSAEGEGVVRSINTQANTITVDHGPIDALHWPAMTMAFPVQSPAMLTSVAVGAHVHFVLVNHEGHPMMSEIHVLPAAN